MLLVLAQVLGQDPLPVLLLVILQVPVQALARNPLRVQDLVQPLVCLLFRPLLRVLPTEDKSLLEVAFQDLTSVPLQDPLRPPLRVPLQVPLQVLF